MSLDTAPAGAITAGFSDPVFGAQSAFRAIMDALASPASPLAFQTDAPACGPLNATAAAILLTLADYETPLWLDEQLAHNEQVRAFIAFHCGAPLVSDPQQARLCAVADPAALPPLHAFAQGDPEYPDRSATIILQAEPAGNGPWTFAGPGLQAPRRLGFNPAPADFAAQWATNRMGFPLGVDLIIAGRSHIAGLPRSLDIIPA